MIDPSRKEKMHPRNRFRAGYDFRALIESCPPLAAFVEPSAYGNDSIDYANPEAVKALNQALLKDTYGLQAWDVPRTCRGATCARRSRAAATTFTTWRT